MTRGTTLKKDTPERLTLLRPMVTRRYELSVDHRLCVGCGTCQRVCPREAITLSAPVVVNGRLVSKPRVDIDDKLCSFCGECVVLCPSHALRMLVNGQPEIPVIKGEAFPMLIRRIQVAQGPCEASSDTAYIDTCPTGAISADITRDAQGAVVAVRAVQVDRQVCINCTHCMETGPQGGFQVTKPYRGRTWLDVSLCPEGCQACVDVCPSHALTYDGEQVALDERFCLFCGACQAVCPVPGAVRIERTEFVHTPVHSSAWTAALEKLVSVQAVRREHDIKGQAKRRKLVLDSLLKGDDAQS
jgi:4Fe-4S ferredoxin